MRQILFAPIVMALVLAMAPLSQAADRGNTANDSFNTAKRLLERQVYHDHRVTVYCGATFDSKKNIDLPQGFTTPSHAKRALKVEWEHAVPADVPLWNGARATPCASTKTASPSRGASARKR